MMHEHKTLLGTLKKETNFKKSRDGQDVLDYREAKRIEREIAYNFLTHLRSHDRILNSKEIEGIIYFIGLNLNKFSKLIGVDRSTITNILKGKKASKLLCHALLDALEKELLFPNYFKGKFEPSIECNLDKIYYNRLIPNRIAA
jgi:transcriptional regulator with XRE-family HTH domain